MKTSKAPTTPVPAADAGSTRRGLLLSACLASGALEALRAGAAAEAAPPPRPPEPAGPGPSCRCAQEGGPMRVVGWAARRVAP